MKTGSRLFFWFGERYYLRSVYREHVVRGIGATDEVTPLRRVAIVSPELVGRWKSTLVATDRRVA